MITKEKFVNWKNRTQEKIDDNECITLFRLYAPSLILAYSYGRFYVFSTSFSSLAGWHYLAFSSWLLGCGAISVNIGNILRRLKRKSLKDVEESNVAKSNISREIDNLAGTILRELPEEFKDPPPQKPSESACEMASRLLIQYRAKMHEQENAAKVLRKKNEVLTLENVSLKFETNGISEADI